MSKNSISVKYHVLHQEMYREEYPNHMMFMYFSFRNEADLKFNSSYANKSNFSDVLQQNATIIEDAFKRI